MYITLNCPICGLNRTFMLGGNQTEPYTCGPHIVNGKKILVILTPPTFANATDSNPYIVKKLKEKAI